VISYSRIIIFLFLFGTCSVLSAQDRGFCPIILKSNPDSLERRAATVLQKYLTRVYNIDFPIYTDTFVRRSREITIGNCARTENTLMIRANAQMNDQEYCIKSDGESIALVAGKAGILYAVYTILEELGFRKLSREQVYLPVKNDLRFPEFKRCEKPVFRVRLLDTYEGVDDEYAEWHKLQPISLKRTRWQSLDPTIFDLVPPAKWFDKHPEYFSLVNGKRISNGQLCFSNPDVVNVIVDTLKKMIAANPRITHWMIAQNENALFCQCGACSRMVEADGGQSGPLLHLVNRVALKFPWKTIGTYAYDLTSRPPASEAPVTNLQIIVKATGTDKSKMIYDEKSPQNHEVSENLTDWYNQHRDIMIWEYINRTDEYLSPFPNLHTLMPNILFYAQRGIPEIMAEGSKNSGADFSALKSYLVSKLVWNPYIDIDSLAQDFMRHYYGAGSYYINNYLADIKTAFDESKEKLYTDDKPTKGENSFLSDSLMETYYSSLDMALAHVGKEYNQQVHIRMARLGLDYAFLECSRNKYLNRGGFYTLDAKNNITIKPVTSFLIDNFFDQSSLLGIQKYNAKGLTPEQYKDQLTMEVNEGYSNHKALHARVVAVKPLPRADDLTDGLLGNTYSTGNWVNIPAGESRSVTVDMAKARMIKSVSVPVLSNTELNTAIPQKIDISYSVDGKKYAKAVVPAKSESAQGGKIRKYNAKVGKNARYVRVEVAQAKATPASSGVYIDEIIVE